MINKYDFKAGDPVLVRDSDNNKWRYNIFSHISESNGTYRTIHDISYNQCIPYKGYEYLINTNNKPFEDGDFVVITSFFSTWLSIFSKLEANSAYTYCDLCIKGNGLNAYNIRGEAELLSIETKDIRPATSEEIDTLLNVLHQNGKDWDKVNKKVIPYGLSQFKSGDYLHVEYGKYATYLIIFNKVDSYNIHTYANNSTIGDYVGLNNIFSLEFTRICKASEKKIEKFNTLLKKKGKKWDSEKKEIVDYKWKPEYGTYYYVLTSMLEVNRFCWRDLNSDNDLWKAGNCFKSEEEVNKIIKMIKNEG